MTAFQLHAWNPHELSTAAARLLRQGSALSDLGSTLRFLATRTASADWTGTAAATATARCHDLTGLLATASEATTTLALALARAADDVETARRCGSGTGEHVAHGAAYDADERAARAARTFLSAIGPVATELASLWSQDDPPLSRPLSALDPTTAAAWWSALPAVVRDRLLRTSPQVLGAMTGLPAAVRDAANRRVLASSLKTVRREIALLRSEPTRPSGVSPYVWSQGGSHARAARLQALRQRLGVLDQIAATVSQNDRFLLTLDQRLPGRAVVAVGNPDTARHVAVLVPGMNTTIRDDFARFVTSAGRLKGATKRHATDDGDVAVLAWLGYVTPTPLTVLSDRRAHAAVPELRKTMAGLNTVSRSAGRDIHLTLIGHSYGSLVAGLAVQAPSHVDNLVLAGSPGVGVDHARELAVRRVFVLEAASDGIADVGHFGRDPSSPRFGAEPLSASRAFDGAAMTPARGHSGYLKADTASLHNLAAVVVDRVPPR
jgi:Alpha/beta hydrolase